MFNMSIVDNIDSFFSTKKGNISDTSFSKVQMGKAAKRNTL